MGLFVAGALAMSVIILATIALLAVLMARISGSTAKVLTEAVRDIFWPKEGSSPVLPDPQWAPAEAVETEEEDGWTLPPWETENMDPLAPSVPSE